MVRAFERVQYEAAKLRFQVNFGTDICNNCDGLKAGPGVIATCFQVHVCNYSNVKEENQNPRHLRVLQNLVGPNEKP
jgi:hypothetical protein